MGTGIHDSSGVGSRESGKSPPLVSGFPLIGVLPHLVRSGHRFFLDTARRYGPIARLKMGTSPTFLISHPDYVRHVLQDNDENYHRGKKGDDLELLVGSSLFTTWGKPWLRDRRMIQAAFQRARMAGFVEVMAEVTNKTIERLQIAADANEPLDIKKEIDRLSLGIIVRTLFNTSLDEELDEVGRSLLVMLSFLSYRTTRPIKLPLSLPTPRHRAFRAALQSIDSIVDRIIHERQRRGDSTDDLLSLLLSARDESGTGLAMSSVRDQVRAFLLGGYETTATALSWICYLLSLHSTVERRLHAEVVSVLGGRTPALEDLPRMPYVRMVIEEVMRLYPPAWTFTRESIADDTIDGYRIPAGSTIFISPYVLHHLPGLWSNPEGFDPERFAEEHATARPRFSYMPFGAGPHVCIGNHFAMVEMQLVVAMLVQACSLHAIPGPPVEVPPLFLLRPRDGLLMSVHRRSQGG